MKRPFNIDPINIALRKSYMNGDITLVQAARIFCRCGWDSYVNVKSTFKRFELSPDDLRSIAPLKSAMICRIDWESYAESLAEDIRIERSAEILCEGDERNPHTSRLLELVKLQSWIGHREYQKVIDFETEMYGEDAFSEHLMEPDDFICSVEDAFNFFTMLVVQFKWHCFHPDDEIEYSETKEPGKTFVSESDARWLCEVIARCHAVCIRDNKDVYEICHEVLWNYLDFMRNKK